MATIDVYGFEDLDSVFKHIRDIPWEVTEDALQEMGAVLIEKVKREGDAMGIRDPESSQHVLDTLTLAKAKKTDAGGIQNVTFKGSRTRGRTRTRNAEIAFVNEYGKRGQQARPFMAQAMKQHEKEIREPGEKRIGDWLEKEWKN